MGKYLRKAKERLNRRIKNYERIVKLDSNGGKGLTRPGSLKK